MRKHRLLVGDVFSYKRTALFTVLVINCEFIKYGSKVLCTDRKSLDVQIQVYRRFTGLGE